MSINKIGWTNITIQVKQDFRDHFEDIFQQSGANSKGQFLSILLENYLNPDNESAVKKAITPLEADKQTILRKLSFYENGLKPLFDKTRGKTIEVEEYDEEEDETETKEILIERPEQIFEIMIKSFELNG